MIAPIDRVGPDAGRALEAAGQLTLLDLEELARMDRLAAQGDRDATIRARFLRFHDSNPEVYRELVAMARELKASGHDRIGVRMLWEALRWRRMIRTSDPSGYKLNDHYPAHYARRIMDHEPDLDEIFATRQIRTR